MVVVVVRPEVQIDVFGLPRKLHLIGNEHNGLEVRIALSDLVLVNLLRHVRHSRQRRLVAGDITMAIL